jgi:hypothetical protein
MWTFIPISIVLGVHFGIPQMTKCEDSGKPSH